MERKYTRAKASLAIVESMRALGLTNKEIARRAGIHLNTLKAIASGKRYAVEVDTELRLLAAMEDHARRSAEAYEAAARSAEERGLL